MNDFSQLAALRYQERLHEADQERLAARVPRRPSAARRNLALACRRLADWLEDPLRYVRTGEAGPADWLARSADAYIGQADSITPPAARDSFHDVRRTNFVSR